MKRYVMVSDQTLRILRIVSLISGIFFVVAVYAHMQDSLWRDEAFSALTIQKNIPDIIRIAQLDNNPPLFHLLTHILTLIGGHGEVVLRSISLAGIIGTILLLRYKIKNLYIKEIATIIFLTNTNAYLQATEARYYGLWIFLAISAFILMTSLAKKMVWGRLLLYALTSIALLYTHSLSVIIVTVNSIILLTLLLRSRRYTKTDWMKIIAAHLVIIVSYMPWIYTVYQQYTHLSANQFWLTFSPFLSPVISFGALGMMLSDTIIVRFSPFAYAVLGIGIVALLGFFIAGAISLFKKNKGLPAIYFILIFILFYLLSFKQPILYGRYIIFLLPFLAYVCAHGIVYIAEIFKKTTYTHYIILSLTLLWLVINGFIYLHFYTYDPKSPMKEIAAIAQKRGYSTITAATNEDLVYYPCEYYFKKCFLRKDYDKINKAIGMSLISQKNLVTREELGRMDAVVWIYVNDNRQETDGTFANFIRIDSFAIHTPADHLYVDVYIRRNKGNTQLAL